MDTLSLLIHPFLFRTELKTAGVQEGRKEVQGVESSNDGKHGNGRGSWLDQTCLKSQTAINVFTTWIAEQFAQMIILLEVMKIFKICKLVCSFGSWSDN